MKQKLAQVEILARQLCIDRRVTHGLGRALRNLSKEIALFRNHSDGLKKWKKRTSKTDQKLIQIGGGRHTLSNFFNIDIVPPADLVCDVREGIPLPANCATFVFSEHFLEHLDYPKSAKLFVQECHRILKRNGMLVIGVPDSEQMVNAYVRRDKAFFSNLLARYASRTIAPDLETYMDLLNMHFRDQDDDSKYNPHIWAYDEESLKFLLKSARFSTIDNWNIDDSIVNPKRRFSSIYVAGTK
jgi:SAM-dependent methyltransferase